MSCFIKSKLLYGSIISPSSYSVVLYSIYFLTNYPKIVCQFDNCVSNYSVCEKFQTTRAKVAPVNLIYGSHFSATEATYKVSLKMVNFVEFTRTSSITRRKPVPV